LIFDKEKEKILDAGRFVYWWCGTCRASPIYTARFWHKVLFDLGIVSTDEPYQRLFNQGMILAFAYESESGSKVSW